MRNAMIREQQTVQRLFGPAAELERTHGTPSRSGYLRIRVQHLVEQVSWQRAMNLATFTNSTALDRDQRKTVTPFDA